jgi:hypothetical protein
VNPAYLTDALPGLILSGTGVALVFPILAGAAVSGLPPERTATGSALFNTARQIGGVVGVAAFVAILGGGVDLSGFRAGWVFMGASALAAGALALLLPAVRATPLGPKASEDLSGSPADPDPAGAVPGLGAARMLASRKPLS